MRCEGAHSVLLSENTCFLTVRGNRTMREHMTQEKHRRNCKMKETEEAELPQRITAFTVFAIKIKTECSDTTGGFFGFFLFTCEAV